MGPTPYPGLGKEIWGAHYELWDWVKSGQNVAVYWGFPPGEWREKRGI